VVLALAGAASYAIAAVSQQRAAAKLRSGNAFDPVVLARLARNRRWLLGLIAMAGGYGLQAAALGLGRLVVVEPVFPMGLLFALILAARAEGRRLRRSEWTAAVATIAGLAGFLIAAQPSAGHATAGAASLGLVTGLTVVVAGVCCLLASRFATSHRALILSIGSGIAAGTSGALTKSVVALVGIEHFALFADPRLYLLILVGLLAFTLQQNAFRAAGLAASMPAASVLEPVVGAMLGLAIYAEEISGGMIRIVIEVVAVGAAVWGIMRLARSVLEVCRRLAAEAPDAAARPPVEPVPAGVPRSAGLSAPAGPAGQPLVPLGSVAALMSARPAAAAAPLRQAG
jgi:hypothetical protein